MIKKLILFVIAVIPIIIICSYIYNKDKNKEPRDLLYKLFFDGVGSCFWVLLISLLMEKVIPFLEKSTTEMNLFEIMFYSFIGVALVEECCKWFFVHRDGYNNTCFDEKFDIIVYSVFVSLGFACLENILYVFNTDSIVVGLTRAVLAVPGHACDAIFMGYYLTLAKQAKLSGNTQLEKNHKIKSILVPTILHGIYDFCLFVNYDYFIIVFFIFIIFLFTFTIMKVGELSSNNTNYYKRTKSNVITGYQSITESKTPGKQFMNTGYHQVQVQTEYCTNCGEMMVGPFCTRCGKRKSKEL